MRLARALDVDGRGIDDQRAGAHRRQDVGPDREHMLAGRQHGDDHFRFRDRLAGGGGDRDAVGLGLRRRRQATRSKPTTRCCALTRFAAIGPPMLPRPMKAMVVIAVVPLMQLSFPGPTQRARHDQRA